MTVFSTAASRQKPASPDPRTAPRTVSDGPVDRIRNFGMALGLIVGPLGFLVANTTYAWVTRSGGGDATTQHALALYAAHPVLIRVALNAALIGSLFIIPGLLGAMQLLRKQAPRLSLTAGTMMIAGYICYFGINASTFAELGLAERGVNGSAVTGALDAGENDPAGLWIFLVFVLGNLVGTLLLSIALWRSRTVAKWAAVAVFAWPVLHVIGLIAGTEWFEVAGAVLQAAGFAAVASVLLARHDKSTLDLNTANDAAASEYSTHPPIHSEK
jgi:uncharacterized integral membrane protein